jgi:hypothetical protein
MSSSRIFVLLYPVRAACFVASPSCNLFCCITFVRFILLYHLRAICFIVSPSCDFVVVSLSFNFFGVSPSCDLFCVVGMTLVASRMYFWMIYFLLEVFRLPSWIKVGVGLRCKKSFTAKMPLRDIVEQWGVVAPLDDARSNTTFNYAATSLAMRQLPFELLSPSMNCRCGTKFVR